ncbi:MAG: hypothetical protein ACK44Z_13760 [Pirellulaceae bacterium]
MNSIETVATNAPVVVAKGSHRLKVSRRSMLMGVGASLLAGPAIASPCPPTEVWEVSTRHLGCCVPKENPVAQWETYRSEVGTPWQQANLLESLQSPSVSADAKTILYAHGNWMTRENSRGRIWYIVQRIRQQYDGPLRLIMLSWPSQREPHPVRDIRQNAQCADSQAFHLASLMLLFPSGQPLGVLGFSFGGRVVTAALHLVSGGKVQQGELSWLDPSSRPSAMQYRVGLVAPAVDRSWLSSSGRHHLAMRDVDQMVNLYNSQDPVLRRFRFIEASGGSIAAGFTGFLRQQGDAPSTGPLASQQRLRQFDCGGAMGVTHDERSYYRECPCFSEVVRNILWHDASPPTDAPVP